MLETLYNKVGHLQSCLIRDSNTGNFLCIFQNISEKLSFRTPPVAASCLFNNKRLSVASKIKIFDFGFLQTNDNVSTSSTLCVTEIFLRSKLNDNRVSK